MNINDFFFFTNFIIYSIVVRNGLKQFLNNDVEVKGDE